MAEAGGAGRAMETLEGQVVTAAQRSLFDLEVPQQVSPGPLGSQHFMSGERLQAGVGFSR